MLIGAYIFVRGVQGILEAIKPFYLKDFDEAKTLILVFRIGTWLFYLGLFIMGVFWSVQLRTKMRSMVSKTGGRENNQVSPQPPPPPSPTLRINSMTPRLCVWCLEIVGCVLCMRMACTVKVWRVCVRGV